MPRGGPYNIKNHDLVARYHANKTKQYECNRASYPVFANRVLRQGRDMERALKKKTPIIAKIKGHFDDNGRECSKCKEYKPRSEYTRNKVGVNGKDSKCISCKKEIKKEYRSRTGRQKDNEYRKRIRTLAIEEIIQFASEQLAQDDILKYGMVRKRQVVDKKPMQAYRIYCNETNQYDSLDTTEGNPKYKKFIRYNL